MEMFIGIVLLCLSLMVNFKDRITLFVLMETSFIVLAIKKVILFSFERCNDIHEKKDIAMVTIKPKDNIFKLKWHYWQVRFEGEICNASL